MPEILVAAKTDRREDPTIVLYRERVTPADVEDDHSAAQLIERVAWALSDAEQAEQDADADDADGAG
jgi:hypothetical protein